MTDKHEINDRSEEEREDEAQEIRDDLALHQDRDEGQPFKETRRMSMKKIEELTEEEVLELSDEQVTLMVDFGCAEKGVKLLERPVLKEWVTPPHDMTIYSVGDFSFVSEEEAKSVVELINGLHVVQTDWDYQSGTDHEYLKETVADICLTVTAKKVHSSEHFKKLKEELELIKKEKTSYETLLTRYKANRIDRAKIADVINEVISSVWAKKREKENMVYENNRYLVLSEGNATIAMNFLRKAHSISNRLTNEICPGYFEEEDATEGSRDLEIDNGRD